MGVIGNVPFAWIQGIPKNERKKKIQAIYKAFDEAAVVFRNGKKTEKNFWGTEYSTITPSKETAEKASKVLTESFQKNGVSVENIQFEEIGTGCLGTAFKFTVNGADYVLKVYHSVDSNLESLVEYGHGTFHENNRDFFLQNNTNRKNQYALYYFGNIKSSYMVEKYITNRDKIKRNYPLESLGLKSGDVSGNTNHNGVILRCRPALILQIMLLPIAKMKDIKLNKKY